MIRQDYILSWHFPVPVEIGCPAFNNFLKLFETLFGDQNQITFQEVGHVKLLGIFDCNILNISCWENEIRICFESSYKCQPIFSIWFQYFLEIAGTDIINLLRFNNNNSLLIQFGGKHDLECFYSQLCIDLLCQIPRHRSMGLTTTLLLRTTYITNSCFSSSLLWSWLLSGPRFITNSLDKRAGLFAFHLEIMENFGHDITSELVVEVFLIEFWKNRSMN